MKNVCGAGKAIAGTNFNIKYKGGASITNWNVWIKNIDNKDAKLSYSDATGSVTTQTTNNKAIYYSNGATITNSGNAGYNFINKTTSGSGTLVIKPKDAGNTLFGTNMITFVPYEHLEYEVGFKIKITLGYKLKDENGAYVSDMKRAMPTTGEEWESVSDTSDSFYRWYGGSSQVTIGNVNSNGFTSVAGYYAVSNDVASNGGTNADNQTIVRTAIINYLLGLGVDNSDIPSGEVLIPLLGSNDFTWDISDVKIWKEKWVGSFRVPYGTGEYQFCVNTGIKVSDTGVTDTSVSGICDCNDALTVCPDSGNTQVETQTILTQ